MAPNIAPEDGRKPPPRPRTATNYTPTHIRTVTPHETLGHLRNERQKPVPTRVHSVSRDRLTSPSQARPGTPNTMKNSFISSAKTTRTALSAAHKGILEKMKPAVGIAVEASKKAALTTANRILSSRKETKKAKKDKKKVQRRGSFSSTDSEASSVSLYRRRKLPKLRIPDINVAVTEALNSACSTDTQESENFRLLEISPTSRELKDLWLDEEYSPEICAEFHNMLSARRRVRKGKKFGAIVQRYCSARSTWRDSWVARAGNDNVRDRWMLKGLTEALQEQKDLAVKLVQQDPNRYPELQPVSEPGKTLNLWWQHKSTVPVREKGWMPCQYTVNSSSASIPFKI
ncbi:hypothetical protein NPX13_g8713 [Xylaria arbuscula]|uniref:Uncharacterized protein n=1 Tax=Xylaria arbuscula TaxID=114810 RepID=A0A9W8N852_9PEZI|nr:hypothetical protein NPX13_g8713 [Xylaria arbuscula]